ncbi:SPFH domain-containing protein [uncultured Muribaculum sp.]|uniref:SPFH domain-containing protein n=1 Tax=uncultured Muribaculum sp. TaxID=1918613 RepID=UPI002670B969|nr:SPFH domain-containing protein [uncultured Muribaculum sp.]
MINKNKILGTAIAVVAVVLIALSGMLLEDADKSKNYVCQMPMSGTYRVWTDGGLQWQGLGTVREYSKTSQIEFTELEKNDEGYVASGENSAASTTFNDKGRGFIVGSFRVVLPTDEQNMTKIQRDFGSEKALINNLVRPTLYKVVTSCGPLMSSLESVSETRTDLIHYITDQLNNGVYKTRSRKVEVVNEITGETEVRTQAEIITDNNSPGNYKRQENSPFSQYGITCGLVSITDIKYDKATQSQIDAQKQANLAVITAKTQATKAAQDAITIEEQGKAAAAKAKWEQEKLKAVAVTRAEQEKEVSRLAAEKAKFDKEKIIAQGQAEAEANRLKVQAGLTPQEKAEWDYKTAVGVAEALANSKVQWVPQVMMGGQQGGNTAMDAVGLKMLLDVSKSIKK